MEDINKAIITLLADEARNKGISNKCSHVAGGVSVICSLPGIEGGAEIFALLKHKGLDEDKLLKYLGEFCAFGEITENKR